MIRDLILPQLAMGMSEGTIVEWAVAEGAKVLRDETLLTIETEKVATDIPAPYTGFVQHIGRPGDTYPVETLIGRIADTIAEYETLAGSGASTPAPAPTRPAEPAAAVAAARPGRIRASGLAKALARKAGIDLAQLAGSGPGGRIVRRDVIAAGKPARKSAAPALPAGPQGLRAKAVVPLTGMRATIAQRMLATKTDSAQTYVFFEIDVSKLLAVRRSINSYQDEQGTRISLLAFYARAVALACQHVPICNATLIDNQITLWENVNIGIAVAIPGRGEYDSGLVVPVLREVQSKGVQQIDAEIKALVARARAGTLAAADMADGSITISSTDGFLPGSWMQSTPLLTLPQVTSIQPGTPIEKPVVVDGQIVVRTMLPCSITFDHRAYDGEPVARFSRRLRDLLTAPELMLL